MRGHCVKDYNNFLEHLLWTKAAQNIKSQMILL